MAPRVLRFVKANYTLHREANSPLRRKFVGEPTPVDERRWWALQNRLGNIWSQIAVAPIGIGLIELAEGRYLFAGGYLLLGFLLAFLVSYLMNNEEIKNKNSATPRLYRYVGIGAVAITWILFAINIYSIYGRSDLRMAPFAPNSAFFSTLPMTSESVTVWCFPYEPLSCSIALQYRKGLAARFNILNWGNFLVGLSPREADFKGINIATRSDQGRPNGAKALYGELRELRVPCEYQKDEALGPNEFELWIGGKP
jgi:hypothetical protein